MNFIFVGDTNVGKTSIINYLLDCKDKNQDHQQITIGTNIRRGFVSQKKYILIDSGDFFLNEFNILSHLYRVDGIFIVYDICDPRSFANAKKIYRRLSSHQQQNSRTTTKNNKTTTFMLLANKAENIMNEKVQWGYARINCRYRCYPEPDCDDQEKLEDIEIIKVSAKTGLNIKKAFHKCVDNCIDNHNPNPYPNHNHNHNPNHNPYPNNGETLWEFTLSPLQQFITITNSCNKLLYCCCGCARRN